MADQTSHPLRAAVLFLAICIMGAAAGCVDPSSRVVAVRPPAPETPAMNLPRELRARNWIYRGEGSCVHASTLSHLRWLGLHSLADRWKTYFGGGGETATSTLKMYDEARLPHVETHSADPRFLQWASDTRRGAIIWFFPSHCVNFVGFGRDEYGATSAYLLDNNRPEQFLRIPRDQFLQSWREYGGFAASVATPPPAPRPFPAYVAR